MSTSTLQPSSQPHPIQLTPAEDKFFHHLSDFALNGRQHSSPPLPPVECRIAGGWVRDKLLGLPSNDLDVTLSTISGYPFATAFVEYLHNLGDGIEIKSIGKVEANPEQSKHLETATTTIMGLECDFVQLRSESYAEGSRIPSEVRLGTPLEDAERRDITINTLFFNVHTRQVEDWTQKGLSDLANHRIRTPLPPLQTFQDDPLRILRCLRFASRFGYELDEELKESLKDEGILESLRTRISRERVGIEVEKMLKGPNPLLSIQLITSLHLYPHIFCLPSSTSITPLLPSIPPSHQTPYFPAPHPPSTSLAGANILSALTSPAGVLRQYVHPAMLESFEHKGRRKWLWLGVGLLPYREGMVREKKKDATMADVVIRDGLKLGNHDRDAVTRLFSAYTKLASPSFSHCPPETIRSNMGLLLRDPAINDPATETNWGTTLLFALVVDLMGVVGEGEVVAKEAVLEVLKRYYDYAAKVVELGLDKAIEEKPRVDGNLLNSTLSLKPSQLTKFLLIEVVRWQLDHPAGTIEECKQFLLQAQAEGKLPTMESAGLMKRKESGAKGEKGGMNGKGEEGGRKKSKKA